MGKYAFPSGDSLYGGGPCHDYGMTLRDYFAAKALPICISLAQSHEGGWDEVAAAVAAYAVADAMLGQRAQTTGEGRT